MKQFSVCTVFPSSEDGDLRLPVASPDACVREIWKKASRKSELRVGRADI